MRSKQPIRFRLWFVALWTFVAGGLLAFGHVSDTSLLRIQVRPEGVTFEWNVDLLTLKALTSLDLNGDGKVERSELIEAGSALEPSVRSLFQLSLDNGESDLGKSFPPEWQGDVPDVAEGQLQSVHVNLRFERLWTAGARPIHLSTDVFQKLGAKHSVIVAVIQGGHSQQTILTQDFSGLVYDPAAQSERAGPVSSWDMLKFGVEHILTGTDHLLFLFTLLVAVGTWRQLIGIVTAFTLAHSVTLGLAVFEVVRLPEKLVESVIAGSIAWVALENLIGGAGKKRWMLTFGFGLIHGFGFAGALRELELPPSGLIQSLLLFNLGVEGGQLLVVLPVLPLILWSHKYSWHLAVRRMISGATLVLALWWLVERMRA